VAAVSQAEASAAVAAAASNHEQTILRRCAAPEMEVWSKSEWSWRRTSLPVMAGIALVDSLFIPMSRDIDRAGQRKESCFCCWVSAQLQDASIHLRPLLCGFIDFECTSPRM
jgi:hypothetical protein